jgi:hypothetical protein
MSKIYYIDLENKLEATMTISFKSRIDWLEEGLSILSWKYHFISESETDDLKENYLKFRKWRGNSKSKKCGHSSMSIGDIVEISDGTAWIVVSSGWQRIPRALYEKINIIGKDK